MSSVVTVILISSRSYVPNEKSLFQTWLQTLTNLIVILFYYLWDNE